MSKSKKWFVGSVVALVVLFILLTDCRGTSGIYRPCSVHSVLFGD